MVFFFYVSHHRNSWPMVSKVLPLCPRLPFCWAALTVWTGKYWRSWASGSLWQQPSWPLSWRNCADGASDGVTGAEIICWMVNTAIEHFHFKWTEGKNSTSVKPAEPRIIWMLCVSLGLCRYIFIFLVLVLFCFFSFFLQILETFFL